MKAKTTIRDRLQIWFPTFGSLVSKVGNLFSKQAWFENKKTVVLSPPIDTVSVQPIAPFVLGLDNLSNLETLPTGNFLELIRWDTANQVDLSSLEINSLAGNRAQSNRLSTEAVLESIQWDDSELATSPTLQAVREADNGSAFLIGLGDLTNLGSLLITDLCQLMKWEAEGQTILPVASEDVNLLEDLLENFPEE